MESHHQSSQDDLCGACADTQPPSVVSASSCSACFSYHRSGLRKTKIHFIKKSWKLRTGKQARGGHCKAGCCHPGLCSGPWHLPGGGGGCILCPAGRFQLTCWECPQWVTTFNSIGAICCPLGCFWTAAWLRTQLVTGNVTIVWLIFKNGAGVGSVGGERKAQT